MLYTYIVWVYLGEISVELFLPSSPQLLFADLKFVKFFSFVHIVKNNMSTLFIWNHDGTQKP